MDKKEAVELAIAIIRNNQGISSYAIMAKMIEQGYEYEHNNKFEDILSELMRLARIGEKTGVCYNSEHEKFTVYQSVNIPVMIHDKRINCYDCEFAVKSNIVNSSYGIAQRVPDLEDDDIICAINPMNGAKLGMRWADWFKCPINEALEAKEKGLVENAETNNGDSGEGV